MHDLNFGSIYERLYYDELGGLDCCKVNTESIDSLKNLKQLIGMLQCPHTCT